MHSFTITVQLFEPEGQGGSGGEHCQFMRYDNPWLQADEWTMREVRRKTGKYILYSTFNWNWPLSQVISKLDLKYNNECPVFTKSSNDNKCQNDMKKTSSCVKRVMTKRPSIFRWSCHSHQTSLATRKIQTEWKSSTPSNTFGLGTGSSQSAWCLIR